VAGVFLRELTLERMDSGLGRRHCEDEPTSTNIDRAQVEDVTKKGAVGLGILAVKQKMSSGKHEAEYIRLGWLGLTDLGSTL
jgi:hypothetical protein